MRFKEHYLQEAKNLQDLYHFTSIPNLLGILKDNTIKGQSYEDPKKDIFGVSLTRNKNASLSELGNLAKESRITLDASKLSNSYKISPRDEYFSDKDLKRSEAEEFLSGSIKDAMKYIKEITLFKDQILKDMLKKDPIQFIKIYVAFDLPKIDPKFGSYPAYKESIQKMKNPSEETKKEGILEFIDLLFKSLASKFHFKVSLV